MDDGSDERNGAAAEAARRAATDTDTGAGRPLSPAARRALEEAAARRADYDRRARERPKEIGGGKGPEPVRYGDWEVGGRASDF